MALPYGNVTYADEKNHKYPIDTKEHVRAAWSYINMPKNAKKYSPGELASIKAKIKTAAKKFGVEIADNNKATSRVVLFSSAVPELDVPDSNQTHFYAAGRLLSWFPTVNKNGFCFLKDDVPEHLVSTLIGSLLDVQHVKKGYGISDPMVGGETNTIVGSITQAMSSEQGIDIVAKVEREVARAFGFTSEDFAPGEGPLAQFSQECDYTPSDLKFLVLDNADKTNILKTLSYSEGVDAGLDMSSLKNGVWQNQEIDGNPVVAAIKPLSFCGAGFVSNPADSTAEIYKMAAAMNSGYMGMDDMYDFVPKDMVSDNMTPTTDTNYFSSDFQKHPDLLSADVDKFHDEKDDDPKVPDSSFAAVMTCSDFQNTKDGKPVDKKTRLFRIKNDKGEFDRKRLIAAYQAMCGLRGNIDSCMSMPGPVRAYAMARVRHGLKMTRPLKQMNKEIQVNFDPNDVEALNAEIAKRVEAMKMVSQEAHNAIVSERDDLKTQNEKLVSKVAELETALTEAKAKVEEFESKALSATRLAELEKVLPYSDEEKSAETFAEYEKSLAKLSDEGFKIEVLTRTVAAKDKQHGEAIKAVANTRTDMPRVHPVPNFSGEETDKVESHILY